MTIYAIIMSIHSFLRWIAVALLLFSVVKSLNGLYGNMSFTKFDKWTSLSLVSVMHLQLLTGLVLYFFLSPLTKLALLDFASAMKDQELRFWAVEHFLVMIFAVIAVQIGYSITKRAEDHSVKFRFQSIFYTVALLLVFIAIPWTRIF